MKMKHIIVVLLSLSFALASGPAWASLSQTEVSQLYVGVFGRASEGGGNSYWQTDPGSTSMTVTANVMLNTAPAIAYFGATLINNQAFIEHIYSNTLGKTYAEDPSGINYWVGELDGGKTKGEVIAALIVAAQLPVNASAAQDRFNNKVEVSNYCAEHIIEYTNNLATFVGFIADVTDTASSVTSAYGLIDVDSSNLDLCTTSSTCTSAGGYWWSDDTCNSFSEPTDCNGDVDGTAYLDECGNCVEGNTGATDCSLDCEGTWGGTAVVDACGVCDGDGSSCASFGTVVSAGQVWMDRNLGASRVATSLHDEEAYGDLYQWGRGADGHEKRDSATISSLSSTDDPGHGYFITLNSGLNDWRSPQNDNLWQGESGTNNPCPSGFRLPTATEWGQEMSSWPRKASANAFASPLKIVAAGIRNYFNGEIDAGDYGYYWSSMAGDDLHDGYASSLDIGTGHANLNNISYRARGKSVRCIKDQPQSTMVTGIIYTNTVWSVANSPYIVTGTIQVADDATLTIEPGVQIVGNNYSIKVFGSLIAVGTPTSYVKFDQVEIEQCGLKDNPSLIKIEFAKINGGSLSTATGAAMYGSLQLRDSILWNLKYMYLWYPVAASYIERNIFENSGGISVGTRISSPVYITNNVFVGYTSYAVNNWASYGGQSTIVSKNSFLDAGEVAVRLTYSSAAMTATNNYWGTTLQSEIQSMIYDKTNDLSSAGYITFTPFLTQPDPATPDYP
jgi:uncharacterized protein (TIGR02145 family)